MFSLLPHWEEVLIRADAQQETLFLSAKPFDYTNQMVAACGRCITSPSNPSLLPFIKASATDFSREISIWCDRSRWLGVTGSEEQCDSLLMHAFFSFWPADVCLNFSLFFFLHFQGLKRRPRVANLLRRRMGGVCVPGTSESERMAASLPTSSAGKE